MGTWDATIFGNDTSLDIKEEFFERYNQGEDANAIKNDLTSDLYDDDMYDVLFALAHCLWEVGQLDDEFLLEIKEIIINKEDLELAEELGADSEFLKQRSVHLEKFLEKISVKKENPKKRIAPPVPVESKYRNGAVMVFQYEDGVYGSLIARDGAFFDKETYYAYLLTDIKMTRKPTMEDVRSARILDSSFHSHEYNSFRDSKYYYSFVNCISGYLKSTATKKFEKYNDSVFEIIGYLSDWGSCCSAVSGGFDYYNQKSSDEFKISIAKELTKRFIENLNTRTELIIDEIDKVFILSNARKGVE